MKYEIKQIFDTDKGTITTVSVSAVAEPPPPVPEPAQDLVQACSVPSGAIVGRQVAVGASWQNPNAAAYAVKQLVIAVREPGATATSGPFNMDIAEVRDSIASKVSVGVNGAFTPNKAGSWTVYPTYQTPDGVWHDSKGKIVNVSVAVPPPTPTVQPPPPPPPPVTSPTPPPTSEFTHQLGKSRLGAQTWFIANWGGSNPFLPAAQWSGANIWNEQWFKDFAALKLTCIRNMDANATNWSKITSWAQRTLPGTFHEGYAGNDSPASNTGIAIEYQIEMSNKANADLWVTHPYLANDDYFTQEAKLIKANLKPGLRVFIELSNEVWNGSFAQFNQANSAGQAAGLPGSNQYYQGIAHEMYRALQMYQCYQNVFGAAAMGSKVVRVFAQSGNLDLTSQALASVYKSAQWNPNSQKIDMLALAPYIGNGTDGAAETLARWSSDASRQVAGEPIKQAQDQAAKYAIPLVGIYEFGQHHLNNAGAFAKNPVSYDCYTDMLNKFMAALNGVCCHYTLHGTWSNANGQGAWGAFESIGQDISLAHKARAIRDWNVKNR